MTKPYLCDEENAPLIQRWLQERGGIAVWASVDFSRPAQSLTTPALTAEGQPSSKPAYWVGKQPERIITDPAEVLVSTDVEVRRFRVALRLSSNGLTTKCTDASSKRIRKAVAKAGEGAFYLFDYATQEVVIFKNVGQTPLTEWKAK